MKCQVKQLEKSDGKSTSNDNEAAELLCKSFEEIFTSEAEFCPSDSDKFLPSSIFSASPFGSNLFDESEVLNKLRMLQSDKSPGPDGIHPHFLTSCAHALAKPLSLIFRCYDTGALPTDWKLANISPVFKKGSRSDPSNYRPISLTSVPCKIMMMMMMMNELTLTWHIVLRLQGHVTAKKESRIVDTLVDYTSRDSSMSERKARSSVYHEKLAVMTKPERTLADCSKQMRQLPGRHGRRW